LETNEPILMPVGTSGHKGHETVNFGGQEVKDQGHITLG